MMCETCPVYDHRFERGSGYFVGTMYVRYALATPAYLLLVPLDQAMDPEKCAAGAARSGRRGELGTGR